jgi:hypothetical protein
VGNLSRRGISVDHNHVFFSHISLNDSIGFFNSNAAGGKNQ